MCGIIATVLGDSTDNCNQVLLDGLTVLQHRGQGEFMQLRASDPLSLAARARAMPVRARAVQCMQKRTNSCRRCTDAAGMVTCAKDGPSTAHVMMTLHV